MQKRRMLDNLDSAVDQQDYYINTLPWKANHKTRDRVGGHLPKGPNYDRDARGIHRHDNRFWITIGLQEVEDTNYDFWLDMWDYAYEEYDYYYGDCPSSWDSEVDHAPVDDDYFDYDYGYGHDYN